MAQRFVALLQFARALRDALLELAGVVLQLLPALAHGAALFRDPVQHLVEGVGQGAQLVGAEFGRPRGVILAGGDCGGRVRQRQNGLRDPSLQHGRQQPGRDERHEHDAPRDGGRESHGARHRFHVGLEVQGAEARIAGLGHRFEDDHVPPLETVPVAVRGGGQRLARQVRRVARELAAVPIVQRGGDDVGLGP